MVRSVRHLVWLVFALVWNVGCNCGSIPAIETESDPTTTTTSSTSTNDLPCGVDCAAIPTPECTTAVCNTGQEIGPLNTCVVVPLPKGTSCDDGLFCTVNDVCDGAACVGGDPSTCGLKTSPCVAVVCYEDSKTCDSTPVNDGAECTPDDLCKVDGVCQLGVCNGVPKDCSFSPLSECNTVSCNSNTGKCTGTPDPSKDDAACVLTGDLCQANRTCKTGVCQGGTPKDCSALDVGCELGACDDATGICIPKPAPPGTVCTDGINACDVGTCDDKATCVASSAPNGVPCNDHNGCTQTDKCEAGACVGGPVSGCSLYLMAGFETCPNGWKFGGDWECGTPEDVGPTDAHTGQGVIATNIDGLYAASQGFATSFAESPPMDLTAATSPMLSFWAWVHTEGGTFDGWHLEVSTNGGQSFSLVSTVSPPYPLEVAGQPAWGGNLSLQGWQHYSADLSAFAGQTAILRFAFRSDAAAIFPGVYIDDVFVAEPQETPLFITSTTPLMTAFVDQVAAIPVTKTGGSANSVWSINPGGLNTDWVTIDPATGVLGGTPTLADLGQVIISIHVEEPLLPSNFDDKLFTFDVKEGIYYTSFEKTCPEGWDLTGDWQCGVPTAPLGPQGAFVGAQCIGTQLAGSYSNLQEYDLTTATSPDISLAGVVEPKVSFRMWVDTEGSTFDGFNLQVSTDGGMTYAIVDTVDPPYTLTVAGKPAYGGHQAALGWQAVEANLAAYAGQTVRLRFAFRSDSSGTFPGVYIDDILVK